ncbi:LysM peptidoglycan-binding domain-containing protein [Paenibacillus sp. UNC451MF]|uniref:LysM peptidoglycan-binding domain-containing protein n=1 Tax=Paenibacillus sp. UNC451MF TaxID=1449063 RepID=UPI0012DDFD39|nr:LysM peptidoglycan-binding domain-containing protein [Paenibacillus sp. UNC451MF]
MNEQLIRNSVVSVKGNHIKQKRRFRRATRMLGLLTIAILILIVSICVSLIGGDSDVFAAANGSHMKHSVEITKGDTLWSIANHYAGKGQNVREYMNEVKQINDLKSNVLQVGQVLILP